MENYPPKHRPDLPLAHTPERARLDYQNGRGCTSSNGKYLDAYHDEHARNPRPSLKPTTPNERPTMNAKEHAHTIHGIPGRMFARHLDARGLYSAQKWVARKETGPDDFIQVEMRFDDQCKNGHQTFSIIGRTKYSGGCIHDEIAEHFPALAPLIPWHLCSTDGPLHYIENTVYHAGNRDCHDLKKGEFRQHTSRGPYQAGGTPGIPCWTLTVPSHQEREVYAHEKPAPVMLEWKPDGITGEGKERELAHARSSAIWPEATDAELMQEPDALRAQLAARLPALLSRFRAAMAACGFDWKA